MTEAERVQTMTMAQQAQELIVGAGDDERNVAEIEFADGSTLVVIARPRDGRLH